MGRRILHWLSRSLLVVGVLAVMWTWYLYTQRLMLDEHNRRELSHAARDLSTILSALSSSAKDFFGSNARTKVKQTSVERLQQFGVRNPYFRKQVQFRPELLPKFERARLNSHFCPSLQSPQNLQLWTDGTDKLLLPINTQAIFADVAISDAFDYLFIADTDADGKVMFAMEHGAAARRRQGTGWVDSRAREHPDREYPVIGLASLNGLVTLNAKALDTSALTRAGGIQSVRLGQDSYELFTYPITLRPTEGCPEKDTKTWIVGGLVNPTRTWGEAANTVPWSVFVDFETVRNNESARQFELSRIEAAARTNHSGIFILANSDPVPFFSEKPVDESQADPLPAEKERWLRVLALFEKQIRPVAIGGLSDAEAESFWRTCTRSEKLTLIHVAQEGFANPHQGAVVKTLCDKGVLKLDSNYS